MPLRIPVKGHGKRKKSANFHKKHGEKITKEGVSSHYYAKRFCGICGKKRVHKMIMDIEDKKENKDINGYLTVVCNKCGDSVTVNQGINRKNLFACWRL